MDQPSIYTTADGSVHNHERPSIPATPDHPSITPFQVLNINNYLSSSKLSFTLGPERENKASEVP
jgi:hypothetical protein